MLNPQDRSRAFNFALKMQDIFGYCWDYLLFGQYMPLSLLKLN